MKVVAILQARMGSLRLPGKVLRDLAGEPMLARVVQRLSRAASLDQVIVATTNEANDDQVEALCRQRGWAVFRGSTDDVLDRYYQAALAHQADVVVRICADCPMIEPAIVDRVVGEFEQGLPGVAFADNRQPAHTYPVGLDVEVMTFDALARAWREDHNPAWREHVTPYIIRHPELFPMHFVNHSPDLSHLRWSVDTDADLELARRIYNHFGTDTFSWTDVLALLAAHPDWSDLNRHVVQRTVA